MIETDSCYAFDDSSILNSCLVEIPPAWVGTLGPVRKHKNADKLNELMENIRKTELSPARFIESDGSDTKIKQNIPKVVNSLVGEGTMMAAVLKQQAQEALQNFVDGLEDWLTIPKSEDASSILAVFEANEEELKRDPNIPENDDCSIIGGYDKYSVTGTKHLVSADEHFWGYTDLIKSEWRIEVSKEWECHHLL